MFLLLLTMPMRFVSARSRPMMEGCVLDVRNYRFCKNSILSFEKLLLASTFVNLIHDTQTVITTL
jgi:hypothetical protein